MSSPSGVRGGAPAENGFWRILKATERSFLYLYDKIWGGGQFVLASPRSKFWGDLSPLSPPRDLRPCRDIIYAILSSLPNRESLTETVEEKKQRPARKKDKTVGIVAPVAVKALETYTALNIMYRVCSWMFLPWDIPPTY